MHPLEAEAHSRDWSVVERGVTHAQRAAVACGTLSLTALAASATTLVMPYRLTTVMLAVSMGIAMPLLLWYSQRNDAWIVAKEGIAASTAGRTWWLKWSDVRDVVPHTNTIDQFTSTMTLKVVGSDGKERRLPAMDAARATEILRHIEPE
jgi:hypothetical protein